MRRFAVMLILAAAVSCGGDASTSPSISVAGTYTLRSVNNAPLPYVYLDDIDKYEVMSDVRILSDSGTFIGTHTNRFRLNGEVTMKTYTDTGTYSVTGNAGITFAHAGNLIESGAIGTGSFTIHAPAITAVYQKE